VFFLFKNLIQCQSFYINEEKHVMDVLEQRRRSYDRIVADYDRYRPGYPAESFQYLIDHYGLNSSSRVLEIGCGTGQFTAYLGALGCAVDAIDASDAMIAFAKQKYSLFNVQFYASSFEDFPITDKLYDFIISATAFHWVKPEARIDKTYQFLKPDGALVFLYNHYLEDPVRLEVQRVYETALALPKHDIPLVDDKTDMIYKDILQSALFREGTMACFKNTITYDTEAYVGMKGTHSYQNTLDPTQKEALMAGFREVLARHGGTVAVDYETRLFGFRRA
jgi:SAM-dependent methyltransferase